MSDDYQALPLAAGESPKHLLVRYKDNAGLLSRGWCRTRHGLLPTIGDPTKEHLAKLGLVRVRVLGDARAKKETVETDGIVAEVHVDDVGVPCQ